jgi:drug/metabolite transporter (DMT)-like permease
MDPWIPITIAAALIQNARSVGQRRLLGRASVAATAYARFFFGFPLALLMMTGAAVAAGRLPPPPTVAFLVFATIGAFGQVLGNALFIALVRGSNFAVMTTYSKMETVLSPLLSFLLLGDRLSLAGAAGIVVAFLGAMGLAAVRVEGGLVAFLTAFLRRPASLGIAVGGLYAVASTSYRAAALDLDGGVALQALTLLAWVSTLQALSMGVYLLWRRPPVLGEVMRGWRHLAWIGLFGVGASACWLVAFTLQKTGYVLAVGQIEIVFAYAASHVLLKERTDAREIAGILVTIGGIVLVVLTH